MKVIVYKDTEAHKIDAALGQPIHSTEDWCFDGEASNIVLDCVLSALQLTKIQDFLIKAGKKVQLGGTLIITDVDCYEVARALALNHIDIKTFNEFIYNTQEKPWEYRLSSINMFDVCNILSASGFKILSKRSVNYNYVITAERIS